jgi:hypothetical protein
MNLLRTFETKAPSRFLHALSIGLFCGAASVEAANIAPAGTGRLGINFAIDGTYGISVANSGTTTLINDTFINNGVDTFNTANPTAPVSFVGITWATPQIDQVISLTLTMETFFDGGWFGPNSSSPGGGGTLNPTFLTNPTVQFSLSPDPTAAGALWTNAAATSNYLSVLNGHVIGNQSGINPTIAPAATWTLDAPLTGITGIRLIGSEGGLAASQGGFIGVRELAVEAVPEPSTAITSILAGAFLAIRRRSR